MRIGAEMKLRSKCTLAHGGILTESGSRAQIGICVFLRKQITDHSRNIEFRQRIDVSRVSSKSPRSPTSSYAGKIQASFYGFCMARMLKCLLAELLVGNIGVEIPTHMRNDNSTAAHQIDSVNAVTNENV